MKRSWLVQRLSQPHGGTFLGQLKDNPFSFGGGLRNGGLSGEAMDLLRGLFSFDYMGAAEFEWGAVPEALNRLARAKDLVAVEFTVPLRHVAKNWRDKTDDQPKGSAHVFILCRAEDAVEVGDRIRGWAKSGDGREDLKECTHLAGSLRPFHEWDGEVCGWLELDNGFFFFTDREMWEGTARLFGVQVPEAVAS